MGSPLSQPKLPAIILAGGRGTRLGDMVRDKPKPMLQVLGRPFLEYLVTYLRFQGIREICISIGYRADDIRSYFEGLPAGSEEVQLVEETHPLGTGGAIGQVLSQIPMPERFLVVNGDSIARFDLQGLLAESEGVDGSLVGVHSPDARQFGRLSLDADRLLVAFEEKSAGEPSPGYINAGIYLLSKAMFDLAPARNLSAAVSLEKDCIPYWLSRRKRLKVIISDGPFIDIGTPESLAQANDFFRSHGNAFGS